MANGKKYGRELVRAVSESLDGQLISDTVVTDGDNQWLTLVSASRFVEGVVIKALKDNTGDVYVTGIEGNQDGFPLDASESVSFAIDDLFKVKVWVPTAGDGVAWLAIEVARD